MNKLEATRQMAQRTANAEGRAVVILNLNPYSPIYVVRQDRLGIEMDSAFVERIQPEKTPGQLAYEAECSACPAYHDGSPRRAWQDLDDVARASWEADPTPRSWAMKQGGT